MKLFIFLTLLAFVAAKPGKGGKGGRGPKGGKPASPEHILACTNGTDVGDKLVAAFKDCFPETEPAGRQDECPTVDQIKEYLGEELKEDLCVLGHMGWIDFVAEDYDWPTIFTDLETL